MIEYTVKVEELYNGEESTNWYLDGKLHREDGPAREYSDGTKEWWLHGIEYSKQGFLEKTKPTKELTVTEIEELLGYTVKIIRG